LLTPRGIVRVAASRGHPVTVYCPNPDCGRYLIRYGDVYKCIYCLGRTEIDDDVIGEWPISILDNLYVRG